ncbi:FAD binding domain-containing protein [Pusillimonas sp.]|uniref:FAD binding domain-containing protein n=1 Tax=Pusillimonas sp. TaxID=3040095 RepID=UPI0029ADDCFB|nr:FAD binding domain-containing protein [Pusillimonas sp.]MDX3894633.1 FAD binding domain-containing protein [Pusillimonas sp.]
MKAAPFEYILAESLDHALECLDQHGMDAKAIAGGQSLVPMMAMRLARPAVLLDINRLPELKRIKISADNVSMGATTRQRTVEDAADIHHALPLVRDALRWVGHVQTRNRGTVGGSLVHADPSAELPLAAVVLNATLHLRSRTGGERSVAASDFFLGPMFTATGDTECLVGIGWPIWSGGGVTTAFEETAMRHGDFAMASAACQLQTDADGICRRAAIGLGGVDGVPRAFPELAQQLVGQRIGAKAIREVAHAAAQQTEPGSDLYADVEYRRHLATVMLTRALQKASPHSHV